MGNPVIVEHALTHHHLGVVRDKNVDCERFRGSISQLATLVAVKATADLSLAQMEIETPLAKVSAQQLSQTIGLVPILRAGIGMVQPMIDLVPHAEVWHLGLYRDESTAQPIHYYSKLPQHRPVDVAMILDPMLATGGSACMACESMQQWGAGQTRLLSILSAPEGIARVLKEFPETQIFTCAIDDHLDENKFIVPGLGDAGDRIFNT